MCRQTPIRLRALGFGNQLNRNSGIWGAAGTLLTIASSHGGYLAFLIALLVLGLPVAMRIFTFSLALGMNLNLGVCIFYTLWSFCLLHPWLSHARAYWFWVTFFCELSYIPIWMKYSSCKTQLKYCMLRHIFSFWLSKTFAHTSFRAFLQKLWHSTPVLLSHILIYRF